MNAPKRGGRILAIDPGTTHSGVVRYYGGDVVFSDVLPNQEIADAMRNDIADRLAVEMIASYGMAVGREVFETCVWIGRFVQAWQHHRGSEPQLIPRLQVKLHLCKSPRAKDANIRQAIIDLYGGKAEAIGTVKKQGPLYGVKSHAWAALGVAITAANT
jgi:hypothetical protein